MEGRPFGQYRLLKQLDRGGAESWRALDTTTGQTVVVTLQPEDLTADDEYVEFFYREAHAAEDVRDAHLLAILSVGEIDDRLCVVTPFVDGRTLQLILTDGPLWPTEAVSITEQIASALSAAHHNGLIHGDVTPSNIVLAQNNFAYLANLGIAPDLEANESDDIAGLATVLSQCLADVPQPLADVIAKGTDRKYASVNQLARDARAAISLVDDGAEPPEPRFGSVVPVKRPGTVTAASALAFLQALFFCFLFAGHLFVAAYVRDMWIDLDGLAELSTTTGFTTVLGIVTAVVVGLLIWGGIAALRGRSGKLLQYVEQAAALVLVVGYSLLLPIYMTLAVVAAIVVIVLLGVPPSRQYFGSLPGRSEDHFDVNLTEAAQKLDTQSVVAVVTVVVLLAFGWVLAFIG